MVRGDDIHRAERRLLAGSGLVGISPKSAQFSRTRVQREAYEAYLAHHKDTVRGLFRKALQLPDGEEMELDPSLEHIVYMMMTHFFLVGAMAVREDRG